jgi:drug/metabolite transporter (DMT)-like permease
MAYSREVQYRALSSLFAANLLGGGSYVVQKLVLTDLPPLTITLLRTFVGALCMVPLLGAAAWRWPFKGRDAWLMLAAGGLGFALPLMLGLLGLRMSTAANGSILVLLEPMGIVILSAIFFRERISRSQGLGLTLGIGGALIVVLSGAGETSLLSSSHLMGNIILAVHGFLWSIYTVAARPLLPVHGSVSIAYGSSLVTLALLAPFWPLELEGLRLGAAALPALGWCVGLGVFVSFLSTVLWMDGLRLAGPIVVAAFVFLQPVTGALLGYFVLGEVLAPVAFIGAALVGSAVLLVARPSEAHV